MTSKTFLISDFDDTITKTIDDLIPYVVYGIIVFAYNTKLGFESKVVFQTNEAGINFQIIFFYLHILKSPLS